MVTLDGTAGGVDAAPGYRITAPGLVGTVTARLPRRPGSGDRGPEQATEALDLAFERAGLVEIMNFDLDVREVPPPPSAPRTRTVTGEDAFVLETPDLGPEVGQVVVALDEAGAVTWTFPETGEQEVEPPATRGAGGMKRFVIRQATPAPPAEGGDRGLFGAIGRKLLKVLVYPVMDAVLGPVTEHFANRWETRRRPYLVRSFRPDSFRAAASSGLSDGEWTGLHRRRALLFVHGTFSSSHAAFHQLPDATMNELHQRYEGRVFAFDHFTLSHSPQENAAELAARIPHGVELEVDVVSHSRGGLVTRVLAGELADAVVPGLRVERAVFVAAPNHGTALADADHMISFIDRSTTLLNLAPPGPADIVASVLEAIVTVVKVIGHAALNGLPGLASMAPGGGFIDSINAGIRPKAGYYSIAADYRPEKSGPFWAMVRDTAKDAVVDRIFERDANDLVVPTLGVSQGSRDPVFPIARERSYTFPGATGVHHSNYFEKRETSERLLEWLRPD
ncbi:triacylglycerol lipase [Microbacterium sp. SD291]|uniref:esterase/lipase family protein n=1 Tax=Microbacterium sp. SD291 TaxID=2782007 RepID=UPI001A969A78|nr:hypothetical protein [Microbacterium sp. SD291]MBO0980783.1 hypothetical protein [Microbacterium sp. SD291]